MCMPFKEGGGQAVLLRKKKLKSHHFDAKSKTRRYNKLSERIKEATGEVQAFERKEELADLNTQEFVQKGEATRKLDFLLHMENKYWQTRSKFRLHTKGEGCTKFFHCLANRKSCYNKIRSINVDGQLSKNQQIIQDHILNFYKNLYAEDRAHRPMPEQIPCERISEDQARALELPITEPEVLAAIKSLAKEKSPGPDGMPVIVIYKCWNFIKYDVMQVIHRFSQSGYLDWRLNTSFIALIPKVPNATAVGDYRPISLLNSVYKCITKVLATRLSQLLPSVISPLQSSNIKGRQITDSVLVANELIDSRRRKGLMGLICKFDFRKAFDTVSWRCLDFMLSKIGCGLKWRGWIRTCLETARFSVLINGEPKGFFTGSRGVRQGDPLSPLLFNIVANLITTMLLKLQNDGRINGFQVKDDGSRIPVLQYADDTIVFIDADVEQVKTVKAAFSLFEISSGLQVNYSKTCLFSTDGIAPCRYAKILGCVANTLPSTYLGLPLGAKFKSVPAWDTILARFEKRLSNWKSKLLSAGARMILARTTLLSLPVYQLSMCSVPVSVADKIEAKIANFLWGQDGERKKLHLIAYDNVCQPSSFGGLKFRRLIDMNAGLHVKWLWRFAKEPGAMWREVIAQKFGEAANTWHTSKTLPNYGLSLWMGFQNQRALFDQNTVVNVGDGALCRFWEDPWCTPQALSLLFPEMYKAAGGKLGSIAEHVTSNGTAWNLQIQRRLSDIQITEWTSMTGLIREPRLSQGIPDQLEWASTTNKRFTVKSAVLKLQEIRRSKPGFQSRNFRTSKIWLSHCLPRVNFFVWLIFWRRVLTMDRVQRLFLPIAGRCVLCKNAGEDLDHLLLHCDYSKKIWSALLPSFQPSPCDESSIARLQLTRQCNGLSVRGRMVWRILFHAVVWCIWRERNYRVFQDKERRWEQVIFNIKQFIWNCVYHRKEFEGCHFQDFIIDWGNFIREN